MADFSAGSWLNDPADWAIKNGTLSVTTAEQSDFWRHTHYGFVRDNGHFWQLPAPEFFTATLTFEGDYETLYDQAGLMLRIDEKNWVKCGIEHSDGMTNFSIVVTRGNSDWSVIGQPLISGPQTVRMTVANGAIIAHFLTPDGTWRLMRVADFAMTSAARIGPMACSPERSGFKARFLDLTISSPIENPLHG
ncbi:DUF1349 domain-containing protein [Roseovarius sp. 2305UL8-3]|uniref:DUF1349 domain-containing protein n=1 Tax=Roseovarius conchicola TaxID=3121636 RepID=UPI003528AF9F